MLYTLAKAREELQPYAGDGVCSNSAVDKRINQALERIMESDQWDESTHTMRFGVHDSVFSLPQSVESILAFTINGRPGSVMGRMYQYIHSGPGDLDWSSTQGVARNITDLGDSFATMWDVPAGGGYRLCAFSTSAADDGKELNIRVLLDDNTETNIQLPIASWGDGIEGNITNIPTTSACVARIARVILPVDVSGYVSLYAILGDFGAADMDMRPLGKYHPSVQIPEFRRYRFSRNVSEDTPMYVLALVRLRFIPLVDDLDIVPCSLQALRLMMQALSHESAGDIQGALTLEQDALRIMINRRYAKMESHGYPVLISANPLSSFGRSSRRTRGL